MAKQIWGPSSILAPVPAVIVTVRDENGRDNALTVAWTGTVCTKPSMVSISVRKERFSYDILKKTGEFVINLTTEDMVRAVDYIGVRSGRDEDKIAVCGLHTEEASKVKAPLLKESPLNIECNVKDVIPLGTHDLFLAEVVAVQVDEKILDEKGRLELEKAGLIAFVHGQYFGLSEAIGDFGFSVKKK